MLLLCLETICQSFSFLATLNHMFSVVLKSKLKFKTTLIIYTGYLFCSSSCPPQREHLKVCNVASLTKCSRLKKRSNSWRTSSDEKRWFNLWSKVKSSNERARRHGQRIQPFTVLKLWLICQTWSQSRWYSSSNWPSLKMFHEAKEDEMAVHACHLCALV